MSPKQSATFHPPPLRRSPSADLAFSDLGKMIPRFKKTRNRFT